MVNLIAFDLDDTLYPEWTYVHSGFSVVSAHLNERFPNVDAFPMLWGLFRQGVRGNTFAVALHRLGLPQTPELITELVRRYREHRPCISLYPDVLPALEQLSSHSSLALISDGALISQQRKVEALHLDAYFQKIYLTDLWGRNFWKPHPKAFFQVMQDFDIPGERCLYIGNDPVKDLLAPRWLGWKTALVRREDALPSNDYNGKPDWIITSLATLISKVLDG